MFKSAHKASFEAPVTRDDDEDDDDISLTSTVTEHHDPDYEYEVETILAEQQSDDGMMWYLVRWTDLRLDESTWEPERNLGGDLRAIWEEKKAKHATGELEPFDIQEYYDAQRKAGEARADRHRRRNAKRKRLGLPLTEPLPNQNEKDVEPSDHEAVEATDIEDGTATGATRVSRPPTTQQRIFKGIPGPALTPQSTTPTPQAPVGISRPRSDIRRPSSGASQGVEKSSSANKSRVPQPPSAGYQGTTGKPSKSSADAAAPELTSRPPLAPLAAASTQAKPNLAEKTLKAKESMTQPTGNIFTGGKTRKPRAKFKEVISDPSKDPKFFDKHRYRRLAEKRSRDTEDIAPDISKTRLIDVSNITDLNKGPSTSRQNSTGTIRSPTLQIEPQGASAMAEPVSASSHINPQSSLANGAAPPAKKKRKSVRFEGYSPAFVREPEPMDIDSPTSDATPAAKPSLPNLGQAFAQGSQSSDKTFALGPFSSFPATFNGLPQEAPERPWLTDFLAKERLEFQHTCFAETVATKIGGLVSRPLASGTITSTTDGQPALKRLAGNLAASLLGLYYGQAEFNIIVYPTKCEDWRSILPPHEPDSPSETAGLRYFMFTSDQQFKLMLPPLTHHLTSRPIEKDPESKAVFEGPGTAFGRSMVMKRLFELDYTSLLPTKSRSFPAHSFFLAVPESREAILRALFHWLRACNPNCQIFTSKQAGGWSAFRSRVEHKPGVVIIHEALAWTMRQIPNLSRYLITDNDEYWCLSEPVNNRPMYPSISSPGQVVPPGEVRLTRLFPYRTAILLTPSFLVSEPRRAHEILSWFVSRWVKNFHYRLVTAYNMHEYLRELAEEKSMAQEGTSLEISASLRGLSDEDCRLRYQAAEIAADLNMFRSLSAGLSAQNEDNSPLIYADGSIDPNDEQSLVNWFGWWATLRADQFRKFHVVGSSSKTKAHAPRRGERLVRIPKYSKATLNDPDAVLEVVQERYRLIEESEAGPVPEADHNAAGSGMPDTARNGDGHQKRPETLQSETVASGSGKNIVDRLDELNAMLEFDRAVVLYRFPVSWVDLQMADQFGDFNLNYHRINDWFKFAFPFGNRNNSKAHRAFNTYIGLFYTVPGEWDPEALPDRPSERHPWIAIYRPVNPHRKPYGRCEVVIWDTTARTKFSQKQIPALKDLTFMQRQVIQHVREYTEEKNHGTWLDQVWLGGFDWPQHCNSTSPLEVTLRWLRTLLSNLKEYLPAPESVMTSRGFRKVALEPPSSPSPIDLGGRPRSPAASPANNGSPESSLFVDRRPDCRADNSHDHKSNPSDDEDEDEDTRIIFHPPRATKKPPKAAPGTGGVLRSRCRNRLYEEAQLARARDGASTHMPYTFLPTMEWYAEQQAEGRDFAHVNVDSWEGVFAQLKIGDDGGGVEKGREKGREREREG